MHPTLIEWLGNTKISPEVRSAFSSAKCFVISKEIREAAAHAAADFGEDCEKANSPVKLPFSTRIPAPISALIFQPKQNGKDAIYFLSEVGNTIQVSFADSSGIFRIGDFTPGRSGISIFRNRFPHEQKVWRVFVCAFTMSLINEPRVVQHTERKGSRPERRRALRIGAPVTAWTQVSWRISKPTKSIERVSRDEHQKRPLHFRRGHYRRAESHFQNAEYLTPQNGRNGWYQWIDGKWKGRPEFGTRLPRYAPSLNGERVDIDFSILPSAEKLAAMSAAERAALHEAGFAPSGALH